MRSWFNPFKLEVLLSMSYLCSVEITLTCIKFSLFSNNFPNLVASVKPMVSICNLLWSYVLIVASISSSTLPLNQRLRGSRFSCCAHGEAMSSFIFSLMCLISNLPSILFRFRLWFSFSSNSLILSLNWRFYKLFVVSFVFPLLVV